DEEEAEAPANAAAAAGAQRTGSAPSYGGAQRAAGGQRAAQPSMSEQPTLTASEQIQQRRGTGSYANLRDLLTYAREVGHKTISQRTAPGAPAPEIQAPPSPGQIFSPHDVMQSLSQLSSERGLDGLREEGKDIGDYLTEQLRQSNPDAQDKVLPPAERNAIGMMEQLLGTMQFDQLMNQIVRRWLKQLEVPLLKAMINDPEMLSREDSPAQQLFDRLDNLGGIVPERPPEASKEVREKVDKLIGRVSAEIETNSDVIPETVAELDKIHQQELEGYTRNRQGAVESGIKEHKVYEARRVVLADLNNLIGGRAVPEVVLEMLDAGWKNLLLSTYMREGGESAVFKTYLGIVDQLNKLLLFTKEYNATQEKTALKTYEWIERMLSISAHDKERAKKITGVLKDLLQKNEPPRSELKKKKVPKLDQDAFTGVLDDGKFKPDEIDDDEWQRWLIKCKNLTVDDKGLYKDDDGHQYRVSIAWIDDDHNHYMFVDQSGNKKLSLTIGELALRLYDKSLDMLDGGSLPVTTRTTQAIIENTHEKVVQFAQTDELTGLLSRRAFIQEIERVLRSAKKDKKTHILCYLDLDRFNVVNNTCGHDAGDRLLQEASEIFRSQSDEGTIISHLNGDEFGFIFENCHRVAGLEKAKKIQQALRNFYFKCDENEFAITASIGAVEISKDSESQRELLSAVDSACFAAKEAGRDRIQLSHIDNKILKARQSAMEWVGR
ncbi:MAG: DUF1631 family protein, partial [Gammaproteobacteria bacterium]|nr:DUF1631 family protein [Gammaproteobacteria bacterium]